MRLALVAALLFAACTKEAPVHDQAMRETLGQLRTAIAHYRDDNGRGPATLEELVPRYLTKVPADPVTGSAMTWRLATEEIVTPSADFSTATASAPQPQILEVHSGAPGVDSRGKRWGEY